MFAYDTVYHLNGSQQGVLPVPMWVVTQATTSNGLDDAQPNGLPANLSVSIQKKYSYGTPQWDPIDNQFIGFLTATEAISGDSGGQSPGLVTTTTFAITGCMSCWTVNPVSAPYSAMSHMSQGLPAIVEVAENSPAGTRFTTTTYEYTLQQPYTGLDGRPGVGVQTLTRHTYLWGDSQASQRLPVPPALALGSAAQFNSIIATLPSPASELRLMSQYDANGNESQVTDFGLVGSDSPIVQLRHWDRPPVDTTGWNYRMMQSLTGSGTAAGTLDTSQPVREYDFRYDAHGRLVWEYAPLSGGQALPGPAGGRAAGQPLNSVLSAPQLTLATVQYDPDTGNVVMIGNQDNGCAEGILYDSEFHQWPVTIQRFPDGCYGNSLDVQLTYDRRVEQVTSTTDAAGRVAFARYDDFGRLQELDRPSAVAGTVAEVYADYQDVGPVHQVHVRTGSGLDDGSSTAAAYVDHYEYLDGLGQPLASLDATDPSSHQGHQWTMSGAHSVYANGRFHAVYRPFFVASGPSPAGSVPAEAASPQGIPSTVVYDGLGRTQSVTDFRGHVAKSAYHLATLSVELQDAEQVAGGHQNSRTLITKDGHGRTILVNAHLNMGPDGSSGDLLTKVVYQATGEPRYVLQTGPSGLLSTRQLTYDSLGRLITNTEPNVGAWTYAYDAEGRVVGTSDARGCGTNVFYDLGGRIRAADYSPCDPVNQPAYTPATVIPGDFPYQGAEESYAYDAYGQVAGIADRGRLDSYSYDAAGHLATISRQLALPPPKGKVIQSTPIAYGAVHAKAYDGYSVTNRVMHTTVTGSALAKSGTVTETTSYTSDDAVAQILTSPAGTILQAATYNADGTTHSQTFGDAAGTTAAYDYATDGLLTSYKLKRKDGPWLPSGSNYTAPASEDPIADRRLDECGCDPGLGRESATRIRYVQGGVAGRRQTDGPQFHIF